MIFCIRIHIVVRCNVVIIIREYTVVLLKGIIIVIGGIVEVFGKLRSYGLEAMTLVRSIQNKIRLLNKGS